MEMSVTTEPSTSRNSDVSGTNTQRKRAIDILDSDTRDEILDPNKLSIEPDIPKKLSVLKFLCILLSISLIRLVPQSMVFPQ
jgi:hypothetical protein